MRLKTKLLDIEFDLNLINVSAVARASNYSQTYTRQIIIGEKQNTKARWKVRNVIVKLYGQLIRYIQYDLKLNSEKAA